jgi:hypothetical protein
VYLSGLAFFYYHLVLYLFAESVQADFRVHADYAVLNARHSQVRDVSAAFGQNALIGGLDVSVGAGD